MATLVNVINNSISYLCKLKQLLGEGRVRGYIHIQLHTIGGKRG